MPVYDRGYTHWEPSDNRAWPAWWVVAKRGIAEPLKRRWLLILLLVGFIPAIVKGGIIFVKLKAGDLADLLAGSWTSSRPSGPSNLTTTLPSNSPLPVPLTTTGLPGSIMLLPSGEIIFI